MDCLLPPLITIPTGTWKFPLCTPRHPLPRQQHDTFTFPPPFSILTLIQKMYIHTAIIKAATLRLEYPLPFTNLKNKLYSQTFPPEFWSYTHMHMTWGQG